MTTVLQFSRCRTQKLLNTNFKTERQRDRIGMQCNQPVTDDELPFCKDQSPINEVPSITCPKRHGISIRLGTWNSNVSEELGSIQSPQDKYAFRIATTG